MRFATLLSLALTLATPLHAEIIETQNITELRSHITQDTLVIFDIDNTIMAPVQQLGSDQWFHHRMDTHRATGKNKRDSLELALAEWMSVQNVTKMRLVEPECEQLIHSLQEEGYTVMGLTTRGLGLSTRTVYQLQSLNVTLAATAPVDHDIFFENGQGVLFRQGILFTAGSHKGKALDKFLQTTGIQPKRIVFINDKEDHLTPVDQFCQHAGIPFTGLRYGYLDEWVAGFRKDITAVQFVHFGHILSDEEAEVMAKEINEAMG